MKKLVLFITFFFSLSALYAQTIDVIHLKNGFDARGTITNRTETKITLQSENGRTLTIDMNEIESMEQEQKTFDPKVLIGRWACYRANGERDPRYDMEIRENEGFYTLNYTRMMFYYSPDNSVKSFPNDTPDDIVDDDKDIEVDGGKISYYFYQAEIWKHNTTSKRISETIQKYSCDIDLKYEDGKLKGSIDCSNYYMAIGCEGYSGVFKSLENGCGTVLSDGPGGKWKVYFVKY